MKTFQEQLAEARRISGLSQEQLAKKMNMSRQGVSHWETGRTLPDAETLKQLSQVLNYNFVEMNETPASEAANEPAQENLEKVVIPQEGTNEPAEKPAAPKKYRNLWYCVGCLLLGLAIGLLIGMNGTPRKTALPVSEDFIKTKNAAAAYIEVCGRQSPVRAIVMEEGAEPVWFYEPVFRNTTDVDFMIEEVTQTLITDEGKQASITHHLPTELSWESGLLAGGSELSFIGGFPLQNLQGIRIRVSGTDAKGNGLIFEGYIALSKEIEE